MKTTKTKIKKELDELPNFGKFLSENLKDVFAKTIKKTKLVKLNNDEG